MSSRSSFGTRGILKILKYFPTLSYLKTQNNSLPSQYHVWGFCYFLFSLKDEWGFVSSRLLCWSLLISLRFCITNKNTSLSANKLDGIWVCLSCCDFPSDRLTFPYTTYCIQKVCRAYICNISSNQIWLNYQMNQQQMEEEGYKTLNNKTKQQKLLAYILLSVIYL